MNLLKAGLVFVIGWLLVDELKAEGINLGVGGAAALKIVANAATDAGAAASSTSSSPVIGSANGPTLKDMALAIYSVEDPTGTHVATANNNPGNLKYAGQAGATGADDRGFAIFSDFATGLQALINQILLNLKRHPDLTIAQNQQLWLGQTNLDAPPVVTAQGDPKAYADAVAKKLGVDASTPVADLAGKG